MLWGVVRNVQRAALGDQRNGSEYDNGRRPEREETEMTVVKNAEDTSGYKFGNDGKMVTLSAFSDPEATDIVIPSHVNGVPVRKIGFSAFKANERLCSVVIPDTVQHIESSAFRDCTRLSKVVAGKELRTLGQFAFAGCTELHSVTLPSNLQKLGEKTFDGCTKFTELIVLDMNKNGESSKRFVIASHNQSRRWGYIQASLIYFDSYQMRKYDEGYGVLHGLDDLFNVAEYRLRDSEQLEPYMRVNYENNIRTSIPYFIAEDQISRLTSAGELGLISEDRIDGYIEAASRVQGRCMAYLLDYKERNFKKRELNFDL